MSTETEIDIEKFRTKFECSEHWELKKEFLEKYKDEFSEERLGCLAQTYINIELLGCSYTGKVMSQVKGLSNGLGDSYRAGKTNRLQRTFMGASSAASAKAKRTTMS